MATFSLHVANGPRQNGVRKSQSETALHYSRGQRECGECGLGQLRADFKRASDAAELQ